MKNLYQLYVGDLNHWIIRKNGQYAVKRENEYPGKNAVIVFTGKYDDCKKYIDEKYIEFQISLLT